MKIKAKAINGDGSKTVILTTENPLSSYGQPVVIDGDRSMPAMEWDGGILHVIDPNEMPAEQYADEAALVEEANDLAAKGRRLRRTPEAIAADEAMRAQATAWGW